MRNKTSRVFGIFLLFFLSSFWLWISRKNRSEDFIYLYAGAALYHQNKNPYDQAIFQAELFSLLGGPNPYPSRFFASANPPADFILFEGLSYFSYQEAFDLWLAVIFLSLITIFISALSLFNLSPQEPLYWLALLALSCLPGVIHSVIYHRIALPSLAAFLSGLVLWERGQKNWAGFIWGFLALLPQWGLLVAIFLLLNREFRAFAMSLWLTVLQILPFLFGQHPPHELLDFALSLSRYGSRFVFFDDQSLAVNLYKIIFSWSFLGAQHIPPMLLPSLNLKILRLVGEGLSVIFFFLMALKRGSFSIRISAAMGGALLGSLYSHCGDQIWILPIFLCVLREVAQKKTLFWGLFFFLALNIIAIPDYHVPQPHLWFWSGFWSVGYLAILGIYWALTIKNSSSGSRLKV